VCADDLNGHDWPVFRPGEVAAGEDKRRSAADSERLKALEGATHVIPKLGHKTMSVFSTLASRSIHFWRPKSRPPGFWLMWMSDG
jgi:hypothetical protein